MWSLLSIIKDHSATEKWFEITQWEHNRVNNGLWIDFKVTAFAMSNISSSSCKNRTSLAAFVIGQTLSK